MLEGDWANAAVDSTRTRDAASAVHLVDLIMNAFLCLSFVPGLRDVDHDLIGPTGEAARRSRAGGENARGARSVQKPTRRRRERPHWRASSSASLVRTDDQRARLRGGVATSLAAVTSSAAAASSSASSSA